jgi:hypothetical protein
VIELLFARGEYKIRRAVDALENPILKFRHDTTLGKKAERYANHSAC